MRKQALLSVSDKVGIVDFARGLVSKGYHILSTGGTLSSLPKKAWRLKKSLTTRASPKCSMAV